MAEDTRKKTQTQTEDMTEYIELMKQLPVESRHELKGIMIMMKIYHGGKNAQTA